MQKHSDVVSGIINLQGMMFKKTTLLITIALLLASALGVVLCKDIISTRAFLYILRSSCEKAHYPIVLQAKTGWLFHKEEYDYCLQRLPENQKAITDFSKLLASKGIKLIVVPVPDKIEVYPEKICGFNVPNVIPQRAVLIKRLLKDGVDVIDLLPYYKAEKKSKVLFLPDETHWTQPAIDIASQMIGKRIKQYVSFQNLPPHTYLHKQTRIPDNIGDLAAMCLLDSLKTGRAYYCTSVMVSDTQTYKDTLDSPVLIIGDSYAFCRELYGAHIGAHIALFIEYPVTVFAKIGGNVGGPEMLKFQDKSFVENRKVIVWIFASRGLKDLFMPPILP